MATIDLIPIRDRPTQISIPDNAPPYFKDYVREVDLWAQNVAAVVRQLQAKVAALEAA